MIELLSQQLQKGVMIKPHVIGFNMFQLYRNIVRLVLACRVNVHSALR